MTWALALDMNMALGDPEQGGHVSSGLIELENGTGQILLEDGSGVIALE